MSSSAEARVLPFSPCIHRAAGCKTLRRGKIVVSGKHANYFVNEGGGTSRDFLALVEDVRDRVAEKFGVVLVPEVKIWGG